MTVLPKDQTKKSPSRQTWTSPPKGIDKVQKPPTKNNLSKTKLMASHYGKWYLEPKDFNESMVNFKEKTMQESINREEVDGELNSLQIAQFCIDNGKQWGPIFNLSNIS